VGNGKCGYFEERGFYPEKGIGTLNKLPRTEKNHGKIVALPGNKNAATSKGETPFLLMKGKP